MKNPIVRTLSGHTFVIPLLLALIFGCSTLPTTQTAKDLKSIRGKWEGWGENQKYGRFFITLIIQEEGEWQMKTDVSFFKGSQFSGKAWVAEGKFEFFSETPQLRGTYTLHSTGEKRWLTFMSDDGDTTAALEPSFR